MEPQVDLGNIITIGVILITALASYVRNKTKMESNFESLEKLFDEKLNNVTNRLDTMNGNVKGLSEWRLDHIQKCHGEKK